MQSTSFRLCLGALLVFMIAGCAKMRIEETRYFRVTNGVETNYYRLRVAAKAVNGVSEYRSGWFPASAVDQVFGEVSGSSATKALAVRRAIEDKISGSVLATTTAWLDASARPIVGSDLAAQAARDTLVALNEARRRILAYPTAEEPPFDGAYEIEFNPAEGVVLRRSDEKLVFFLSSDPEQVIGTITNFAESDETALVISEVAAIAGAAVQRDVIEQEEQARLSSTVDAVLLTLVDSALAVAADTNGSIPAARSEVETLILLLNQLREGR